MADINNLADLLPIYYSRLFPFEQYFKWLSYGSNDVFSRREFSFTLNDDIYIRFQSFKGKKALETEIKRIVPFKIDVGAIYNAYPSLQKTGLKLFPVERELIFDIDMTDYDEVRSCCSGAEICKKCWKYMALASKILDVALREDFGFEHILWVFSGRRGIHCWVCDERARRLNNSGRGAIANYLTLVKGGEQMKKKVKLSRNLHPSITRAVQKVERYFVKICMEDQNMLGNEARVEQFLEILPADLQPEVRELFGNYSSSVERWKAFVNHHSSQMQGHEQKWRFQQHLIKEIMLQYAYPRLDVNVTKGINHLLKSPFCIHPKTGKVCIPFKVTKVDEFDPNDVPDIIALIEEINKFDAEQMEDEAKSRKIKDYKKTALNKPIFVFEDFLRGLATTHTRKIEQSDLKMEF